MLDVSTLGLPSEGVTITFLIVAAAIVIDTILGAIKAVKSDYDSFDFRRLPKFLGTGILPYVGGLGILAIAAEFIGAPFEALFYAAAAATTAKYIADIKDKLSNILGIDITHSDGMGGGETQQQGVDPSAGL